MKRLLVFIVLLASIAYSKNKAQNDRDYDVEYHSLVPLGAERIDLRTAKRALFLLATAESPYFEGWHGPSDGRQLFNADGSKVDWYPQQITFRLTATAMRPELMTLDSYGALNLTQNEINDYLLHLQFRMLVFHGLRITPIEPASVELAGMPANVPYDERIFQIHFNLPTRVPAQDRVVLEVLAPTGYRICKFHLDLF